METVLRVRSCPDGLEDTALAARYNYCFEEHVLHVNRGLDEEVEDQDDEEKK